MKFIFWNCLLIYTMDHFHYVLYIVVVSKKQVFIMETLKVIILHSFNEKICAIELIMAVILPNICIYLIIHDIVYQSNLQVFYSIVGYHPRSATYNGIKFIPWWHSVPLPICIWENSIFQTAVTDRLSVYQHSQGIFLSLWEYQNDSNRWIMVKHKWSLRWELDFL